MYKLTNRGEKVVKQYIANLWAKRIEILDAGKDTAFDTKLPSVAAIEGDVNFIGLDDDGVYYNNWGVTDNFDADCPLCLVLGEDLRECV